jgi:pSer/pThr/pTyr-binding forkhead associated (FHA) protein
VNCELRLDDNQISRRHARLCCVGQPSLQDLGSRNGTRVNGRAVRHCNLCHGDVIQIGPFTIQVRTADGSAARTMPLGGAAERVPPAGSRAAVKAPPRALITVLGGSERGRVHDLRRPFVALGELGVRVAVVTRRKGCYAIRGVTGLGEQMCVNGEPLTRQARLLVDGDRIVIGNAEMEFRCPS